MTDAELMSAIATAVNASVTSAIAAAIPNVAGAAATANTASVAAQTALNNATAAANQAAAGAAAGLAAARTQSNVESQVSQTSNTADIGIEEAWATNNKTAYDDYQSYKMEAHGRNRLHFDQLITTLTKHVANLDQITLKRLAA